MSLEKFSKKRVLVVDELEAFRFSTKQALMSLGMKLVDTASNAQTVVAGFQNVNYDLILCNYDLGKGKNGQALLEELRYKKLLKFTGLFFIVSAEVERGKVMGTLENEPDGYLVKPVTPKDLKQRLGKALELKEALKLINEAIDDGDYRSALAYCDERLATKQPYALTCSKTKAWLLVKLGKLKDAEVFYQALLKSGDYTWAKYGLADVQMRLEQFSAAEQTLMALIEQEPDYVEALDLLSELYRRQGKTTEALDTAQKAAELSPNSLLRQNTIAKLCMSRNDPEGATKAFQNVVKLGEQSIYAKPNHYFDFAEHLVGCVDASPEGEQAKKDAFKLLEKANKRFSIGHQIEPQTNLIGACLKHACGEDGAEDDLERMLEARANPDSSFDSETLQVLAKTLTAFGRQDEADRVLEEAADIAANNSEDVSEIYDQLNRNISSEARIKAASFNKEGIKLYNNGEVEAAAKELKMALPLTPRHISLNLNLIQVLLKLNSKLKDSEIRNDIEKSLHKVRHIPVHHYEYPRYQYLLDKFEQQASN